MAISLNRLFGFLLGQASQRGHCAGILDHLTIFQLESSRGKHYQQRQRNLHDLRCPSMSQLLRTSKSYLKIEAKSDNLINMINSTDQFEPLAAWYIWFCVQAFLHSSATRGISMAFHGIPQFQKVSVAFLLVSRCCEQSWGNDWRSRYRGVVLSKTRTCYTRMGHVPCVKTCRQGRSGTTFAA